MTLIKNFAWRGAAVAVAMVMALSMVVSTAQAAALTSTSLTGNITSAQLVNTAIDQLTFTFTTPTAIAADGGATNNVVDVVFPTGFDVSGSTTGQYVLTNTTTGPTVITNTAFDSTTNGVRIETADALPAATYTLVVTAGAFNINPEVAAASTVTITTRDSCTSGNAAGNTAGCATASVDTGTFATGAVIQGLKAVQTTVPADGLSTALLNFNTGTAATGYTAGDTLTITTTAGTLVNPLNPAAVTAAPTIAADGKSATTTLAAAGTTAVGGLISLRASSTVETATVRVYVTPIGGGTAALLQTITVGFVLGAEAPASGTASGAGNATSIGTAAGTLVVTASFFGANGLAAVNGGTVNVTTNLGTLSAPTNGSCGNSQACSGQLATITTSGRFAVTLTHQGNAGVAAVTFTSGGVSAVANITLAGNAATITVAPQAGQGVDLNRTTAATTAVNYQVRDSAGTLISNTPTITAASGNAAGCGTAPTATADLTTARSGHATFTSVANTSPAGTVCTFTLTAATGVTTTFSFTLRNPAGATSVITITPPATCALNTTCTIAGTVQDADGNNIADGSTVNLVVSGGAMVTANPITVRAGAFTSTFLAPGTAQNITVAASSSVATVPTVSAVFGVGGATPPATGDGSFTGDIAPSGVSLVTFDGGSLADFQAAAMAAGAVSVWTTVDGAFVGYIPGAPAVVNAAFTAQFGTGVAAGTIVIIVK